jgi:uncharacterized protein (TIGR03435 family)
MLPALGSYVAFAQDPVPPQFEVASVKPSPRDDEGLSVIRGGPGTPDPEQITYERQHLLRVLSAAYSLDFDQISGPAWLGSDLFTIHAKIPPGTTKEQLKLMWQDLLIKRFHLKAHLIQKDFTVYELSVAKGGPKFHQEPGFPEPRPGEKWAFRPSPRNIRLTFRDYSMDEFVKRIGWPLSTIVGTGSLALGRVIDKTGLPGSYSFTLEFAGAWGPGGAFLPSLPDGQTDTASPLFDALRQQLGLTLTEKKAPLDVLVVDHVERIPTEN